jgi:hypothetical protein
MSARARLTLAAVAAFVLVPAAPALAAWTNPQPVSAVTGHAGTPQVGLAADGTSILTYSEVGVGLFVTTRKPDGTVTTRVPVENAPSGQPSTATNAAGTTVIAWQQIDGVDSRAHMRVRLPGGTMTKDTTVSQEHINVTNVRVGIDAAGDAYVSWEAMSGADARTFLRVRSAGGTLGPVERISPEHGDFRSPHLAVEPGGRAVMIWTAFGPGGVESLQGRARDAAGTLGPVVTFWTGIGFLSSTAVSLNGAGTALVAWSVGAGGQTRAQARTRAVGGALSAVKTLSSSGAPVQDVHAAMGPSGNAGQVSWARVVAPDERLQTRRLSGGTWSSDVQNVTPTGMDLAQFDMGVSGDASRVTFAFAEIEDGVEVVRARERRPDGTFGPTDLVGSANGLPAGDPRVAVNAAGQAAATWAQQQDDARGDLIWVGTNFL